MIVTRCIGRMIKSNLLSATEVAEAYPGKYSWKRDSKIMASTPCFRDYVQVELFPYDENHRMGKEVHCKKCVVQVR
ncbi:hypothetical protein [Tortoise microvirus 21]|nr:hypothetical protein [Tortoise microvirus 21]